ncbi:hypothetical protein V1291_000078 [Nitrobacteraceae bacterium AZCC 1564]
MTETVERERKRPFAIGVRVAVGWFGDGTVIDDYWRDRDRFKVRLDKGGEYDFSQKFLTEIARQ